MDIKLQSLIEEGLLLGYYANRIENSKLFDSMEKKINPFYKNPNIHMDYLSHNTETFSKDVHGTKQTWLFLDNIDKMPSFKIETILRKSFMEFLKRVEPLELQHRIRNFRKLNIKNLNDREITKELVNTFTVDGNFIIHRTVKIYGKGTRIYRVRKLENCDIPNNKLKCQQDYWNPPAECIKEYGRINKPGVSVLYATLGGITSALEEANIAPNDNFILMFYEAKEDIVTLSIGEHCDYELMEIHDKNLILVDKMINDFMCDEFSREVGTGTEHLYRVSGLIVENFYSPPESRLDAWGYPSVKDKKNINLCFRPKNARNKLILRGTAVCSGYNNNFVIPNFIAYKLDKTGTPIYDKWNEDTYKEIMRLINSKNIT